MENNYRENPEIRAGIDKVLHQNVILMQNLGKSSSKAERKAARKKEIENLKSVRSLDKDFIDFLLNAGVD